MDVSRRDLFGEMLASGALAVLSGSEADGQTSVPLGADEIRSNDFWDNFYSSAVGALFVENTRGRL